MAPGPHDDNGISATVTAGQQIRRVRHTAASRPHPNRDLLQAVTSLQIDLKMSRPTLGRSCKSGIESADDCLQPVAHAEFC